MLSIRPATEPSFSLLDNAWVPAHQAMQPIDVPRHLSHNMLPDGVGKLIGVPQELQAVTIAPAVQS